MANEYLDKLRSVGVMRGGRTRDHVVTGRDPDGTRWKATTDELNNTVTERTERAASGVSERQDVTLRPATVRTTLSTNGA